MIKDITAGMYVQGDSPLHRLDPRTKSIGTVLCSVLIFSCKNAAEAAAMTAFAVFCVSLSGIRPVYIIKSLRPMRWFLIFTAVVSLLFTGGEALVRIGIFHITREGLRAAALGSLRLTLFILTSSLLTLTTEPNALTDAFAKLISPLRRFGIPTDDVAAAVSILLRSVPILADEADTIMNARRARGADLDETGLAAKIKALASVAVPLILRVFRRADELSLAMEARCYGKCVRTPRKKPAFGRPDLAAAVILTFFCALMMTL